MTVIKPTITIDTLRRWLAEFSYKPGWEFHLDYDIHHSYSEITLSIGFYAPNSYRPYETINVSGMYTCFPEMFILADDPKARFYDWLVNSCIAAVEIHERDEWAKVNGVLLNDPHVPRIKPYLDDFAVADDSTTPFGPNS